MLLGSHSEGDFKRSALGEYSIRRTLEWKLRITEVFHRIRRCAGVHGLYVDPHLDDHPEKSSISNEDTNSLANSLVIE